MSKYRKAIVLTAVVLALSGCVNVNTYAVVNANQSDNIERIDHRRPEGALKLHGFNITLSNGTVTTVQLLNTDGVLLTQTTVKHNYAQLEYVFRTDGKYYIRLMNGSNPVETIPVTVKSLQSI